MLTTKTLDQIYVHEIFACNLYKSGNCGGFRYCDREFVVLVKAFLL